MLYCAVTDGEIMRFVVMILISVSNTGDTFGCVFPCTGNVHGERLRKRGLLTAQFHVYPLFHYLQCDAMTSHRGICWMSVGHTQTTQTTWSLKGYFLWHRNIVNVFL